MDLRNAEIGQLCNDSGGNDNECQTVQVGNRSDSNDAVKETEAEPEYEVRRLTPTECARLQGFPDDWCADVPHTDSAEYKLWGNGIALPCLLPMFKAMRKILERDAP